MRIQSVEAKSKYLAKKKCEFSPDIITEVNNGGNPNRDKLWKCFESKDDYRLWKNQK